MLKKVALRNKIVRSAFENALADYGRVYLHFVVAGEGVTSASFIHWPDESCVQKGTLICVRSNNTSNASLTEDVVVDTLALCVDSESVTGLLVCEDGVSFRVGSLVNVPWNSVIGMFVLAESSTSCSADYTFSDAPYANAANTAPASFLTGTGSNVVAFKPRPKK